MAEQTPMGASVVELNPMVVMVSSVAFAALFLVLAMTGRTIQAGYLFGAAAVVFAGSSLPVMYGATAGAPGLAGRILLSVGVGAVAETLLSAAAMARVATASSPRLVPLLFVPYLLSSYAAYLFSSAGPSFDEVSVLAWVALVLTALAGVGICAFGGVIHRTFFVDKDVPAFIGPRTGPPPPPGLTG